MLNHEFINVLNPLHNFIYIGVVEDNNDPENRGRVKVRIIGFHSPIKLNSNTDGILTSHLPWAIPANPIQGGSMSGIGWSGVPVNGSHVALFFIGGDHNFPVYFATIGGLYKTKPDSKLGFSDPTGKYPLEVGVPDFNSLASITNTVFDTPDGGPIVEHESKSGDEKWKVTLKATGDYIELLTDGIEIKGDTKLDGDVEITGFLKVDTGATGTIVTALGQVVVVQDGIIIDL